VRQYDGHVPTRVHSSNAHRHLSASLQLKDLQLNLKEINESIAKLQQTSRKVGIRQDSNERQHHSQSIRVHRRCLKWLDDSANVKSN
jgi:DNA-binding transcriptional MerR regulator